ncbi:MAG TPA: aminotransferase class V-fold PLP-dependent enzyme [Thermoanaerobaculia bacterium]|nr:aminotransferase class V-fold PLP-dependent enzyme [Thermoanaerobaculia bacterium]
MQDVIDKEALRRSEFPVTERLIYLNHAAVGPLPRSTSEAMQAHAVDQRDFGALHWRAWMAAHDGFRDRAARLINASKSEIAILKNTSEGLSFVAEGFRWRDGDNVVTTDMEFPSNYTPWKRLERRGVECRLVRNRDGGFDASDIERLIDERTRIVALSSVSFHNGFAPDLDAAGRLCSERGVFFCVDAIQSLGAIPLDVRRSGISFLAADGHKWLLGPEGTAIFFCSEEAREQLDVLESGWTNVLRHGTFIDESVDLREDGRRFEAGSLNTNGVYGMNASLDLLERTGIDAIEREVIRLAMRMADRLEAIGFVIGTPRPIRSGIVAAAPPPGGESLLFLHRRLEQRGIVCAPREGMLRFSPHFYNTDDEIDRVVEALREERE